jgi:hypothetical protein
MDTAIRQVVADAVATSEVIDIYAATGIAKPDINVIDDDFARRRGLPGGFTIVIMPGCEMAVFDAIAGQLVRASAGPGAGSAGTSSRTVGSPVSRRSPSGPFRPYIPPPDRRSRAEGRPAGVGVGGRIAW